MMGVARKPDHAAFAGAQLSVQRARRHNMFGACAIAAFPTIVALRYPNSDHPEPP